MITIYPKWDGTGLARGATNRPVRADSGRALMSGDSQFGSGPADPTAQDIGDHAMNCVARMADLPDARKLLPVVAS